MIIAVINNKGGTGKTTTSVNLSAALANAGCRVLLVDLDAQASASLSLGVEWEALSPSAADILLDDRPIQKTIRPTDIAGLDLITAEMQLAHTDLILAGVPGREMRLSTQLETVRPHYDFILCDCPPSLSMLPVNALVAADAFMVPVTPEYLALEGLVSLMNALDQMKAGMGISPKLLGIVFTLSNAQLTSSRKVIELVREHFGASVFETLIRRDVKLSEAPSYGQHIFDFAPQSHGARAYAGLADEILKRCRAEKPETASVQSS